MGEVKAVTYPKGITVGTDAAPWRYDRAGRLTLIPGLVSAIAYRPNGSTEAIAYGNGVKTAFAYDPDRAWLLKVTHKRPSGATLREVAYARDDAGRVIRATTAGRPDTWSYGYDALDRLVSASNVGAGAPAGESRTFAYDTAGNLTNQSTLGTYVYPTAGGAHPHAPNRIEDGSGQPVKSYGYDGNGNVTLIRQYAGGVEVASDKRLIAYDGENRPVTVSRGGVTVTSVYGPEGERIAKTVTQSGQATKTTWYLGLEIEVAASGSWVVSPHPDVKLVLPAGASARAAPPQDRHCLGHWFFDHRTPAGCRGIGLARESIFGIMMDMISN